MKVVNITMQAINNYGSVYQTLATEKIFTDLGHQVKTIDYIRENAQNNSIWRILTCKGAPFIIRLKMLVLHFMYNNDERQKVFDLFRDKYFHLTEHKYRSDQDFQKYPLDADVYCTGSDQTWNTVNQGEIPYPYFLSFVPKGKKKISFAASFGIPKLPVAHKDEVKRLLSSYDAVSVRESSGMDILNDLGISGTLVLDPTLAIQSQFWHDLASPKLIDEDYLLVYQLNRNAKFSKYMKEYAKKHKLKIVLVRAVKDTRLDDVCFMPNPSPEDLLSLFKYSSKVLTDSFHAIVFSLIFHCDFMAIYPPRFSSRLDDMLNFVGLDYRHVVDFSNFDYCDISIDYNRIDNIINHERNLTIDFLKSSLK